MTHTIHDRDAIDPDPNVLPACVRMLSKLGSNHVHGGTQMEAVQCGKQPKEVRERERFGMAIADEIPNSAHNEDAAAKMRCELSSAHWRLKWLHGLWDASVSKATC